MLRKTHKASSRQGSFSNATTGSSTNPELFLECKAAFLSLHDNIDEHIKNRDDLIAVLQQNGRNPTSRMINKYWKSDTESMTFDEFCDVCKKEPATTSDDLMKAFRRIDLNNDGYLSLQELYKMMTTKGEKMSLDDVKKMLDEVDENKDGRLDYGEFCKMVMKTSEDCKKMSRKIMDRKERQKQQALISKSPATKYDMDNFYEESDQESPRPDSISSKTSDNPKPAPRRKEDKSKSPVSRTRSSKERSTFEEWKHYIKMKGCMFVENDNSITSHWYTLHVPVSSTIHITIQSIKVASQNESRVDAGLFVMKGREGHQVIGCTDTRNSDGLHDAIYRTALEEIFDLCDLDDNGLLSREEFNQFNIRTSEEEVADDEWRVVEDNVELKNGEITKAGFVRLNEMEVEDNAGETGDSWLTLINMGYNNALVLDEACPFLVEIYGERCEGMSLNVKGLESSTSEPLHRAMVQTALASDVATRVKGSRDITMYTYKNDIWAYIVVENKSTNDIKLQLDCRASKNCLSTLTGMMGTVEITQTSSVVVARFVPERESHDWTVASTETLVK